MGLRLRIVFLWFVRFVIVVTPTRQYGLQKLPAD